MGKTEEYIARFDEVSEHIFHIYHRGTNIPPFMDYNNMVKASREALEIHRNGNLTAYYERMKAGAI